MNQSRIELEVKIAKEFSKLLTKFLSKKNMIHIIELNKVEKHMGVCHSHDFCDSNMFMDQAFQNIHFCQTSFVDRDNEIWSNAWEIARNNHFYIPEIPFKKGMKFKYETQEYVICGFDWDSEKPILAYSVYARHQVFEFKEEMVSKLIK